jgi:cytochrome c oxidase cbb3-type subunit 3
MLRNSPTRLLWFLGLLRAATVFALVALPGPAGPQTSISRGPMYRVDNTKGKALFRSSCAVCHGLDGGGGEHAPNIARASAAKLLTDSDLNRILRDGIPGKGMPAFKTLGEIKLHSVQSYLRFLQVKTAGKADTGNSMQGKELFFGKGQCSGCHAMGGDGRFISTDLSDYAYDHNADEIRAAIVSPQEQEAMPHTSVNVTTNAGRRISGFIRNENNSSLQVQDPDGHFYLFLKSDLGAVERSQSPSMPADYRQKLSSTEVEDLVSYIVHQSSIPEVTATQPARHKKEAQN